MMSECDPTGTSEPALDTETTAVSLPESNSLNAHRSRVLFDKSTPGSGLQSNPGFAVQISDSCESVLTELEAEGSGEDALLLPCIAGNSSPPKSARDKTRLSRLSSSSDRDTLASPGNN